MVYTFIDHLSEGYKALDLAIEEWLGFSTITRLNVQDGSLIVQYGGLDQLCKVLNIVPKIQDRVVDKSGNFYINKISHPPEILIYQDDDNFYPDDRLYHCRGNKHTYQINLGYYHQDPVRIKPVNSIEWVLRLSFLIAKPKPVYDWSDPVLSILVDTNSYKVAYTSLSVHIRKRFDQFYDKSLLYNQVDPGLRNIILQTIHNKIRSDDNTNKSYHRWLKDIKEYTTGLNIPDLHDKLEAINESLRISQTRSWWLGQSQTVKVDFKSIRMYRDGIFHGSWFFVLPNHSIWLYRAPSEIVECYLPLAELQVSFI